MKIALGSDHAGYELKEIIKRYLADVRVPSCDVGTTSTASVDYPDFAEAVARTILSGEAEWGILVCGTGAGVSMAANKFSGIRAAVAWNVEIARLIRLHNDANILCLPGRFLDPEAAPGIVQAFLDTPFEGGRHQRRLDKIAVLGKRD
jgi:ribose 5-phosphate isomerase B